MTADDYYRYPAGSPEHRAAYAVMHAGRPWALPVPDDPDASYEIENAYELAAENYEYEDPEPNDEPEADDQPGTDPGPDPFADYEAEAW